MARPLGRSTLASHTLPPKSGSCLESEDTPTTEGLQVGSGEVACGRQTRTPAAPPPGKLLEEAVPPEALRVPRLHLLYLDRGALITPPSRLNGVG